MRLLNSLNVVRLVTHSIVSSFGADGRCLLEPSSSCQPRSVVPIKVTAAPPRPHPTLFSDHLPRSSSLPIPRRSSVVGPNWCSNNRLAILHSELHMYIYMCVCVGWKDFLSFRVIVQFKYCTSFRSSWKQKQEQCCGSVLAQG